MTEPDGLPLTRRHNSDPILIAGGGIGGLTTAIALAQAGLHSHILERRGTFSEAGAGIQIGPNGTHILQQLGIADALAPLAGVPEQINIFDGSSGERLTSLPLGNWIAKKHGAPYWVVHRRDLQRVLLDAAFALPEIEISTNFAVSTIFDTGTSVEVTADTGAKAVGHGLIGADGIWSQVRRKVFKAPDLRPNGMLAARAVLTAEKLPAPFSDNSVGLWLMRDKHVVHYPVHGGQDVAVVLIETSGNATIAKSSDHRRWNTPITASQLLTDISKIAPVLTQLLTRMEDWRSWSLVDAPALPSWHKGRVALLGDAAHPILPFLAQGAVMALEDAPVMAQAIASSSDDLTAAFAAYDRTRRKRVARVQAASRQNGRIYHMTGPAKWARDTAMKLTPASGLIQRYDWLYGWQQPDTT